jgi:uncharacterized protein (TIGR02001 family)
MRVGRFLLYAAALAGLWAPAAAAADISGELGVVSDYRFRGISLSRGNPALQGSVTVEHHSGLYANLWGSTLGHGSETEIDLGAGYATDLTEHFSIDFCGTYYLYPSDGSANYFEGTATATLTRGAVTGSLGVAYVPPQSATRDGDGRRHGNGYVFAEAGYEIPKTPVNLTAGLGYERGAFDEVEHGGKWDWKVGAEARLAAAKFGLAYVGSNADDGDDALVASLFLSW